MFVLPLTGLLWRNAFWTVSS